MRSNTYVLAAVLVAVALAPAALAHHGWSGYETEETELTGTVESVTVANPHATMRIAVGEQAWDITLAPAGRTRNAGLAEDTIPVGAEVTIEGHRSRNPRNFEVKTERVRWNERVFDVYPNRE